MAEEENKIDGNSEAKEDTEKETTVNNVHTEIDDPLGIDEVETVDTQASKSLSNEDQHNGTGDQKQSPNSEEGGAQSKTPNDVNNTTQSLIDNSVSLDVYEQLLEERHKLAKELEALTAKERANQEITKKLEDRCFVQQELLEKREVELKRETEATKSCQNELNRKIEELADCQDNQEVIMARVVVLDTEKMKLLDEQVSLERRNKELSKDNDRLQSLLKLQKGEITKVTSNNEKNESKLAEQTTELKKLNEEVSSVNIKLKWAQNKLKAETEAHKATKTELSSTTKKLKLAKEESQQIRRDMKSMIGQYQESEEMKSNSLDSQLKKKEEELKLQEQEIVDQTQLHELTVKELQLSRESLEISQQECAGLKTRVSELTNQITEKQIELDELKGKIAKEKKEHKKLLKEIDSMKEMNKDIEKERQAFSALRESHAHLQKTHQHSEREMLRRKDKEAELLGFSEKLSSSNAQLTADKGMLEAQVQSLEERVTELDRELSSVGKRKNELERELTELQVATESERSMSTDQLHAKSLAVEELTLSLDEEREQVTALKRKHANNIRDMQRQIQLYSKRIEQLESITNSTPAAPPPHADTNSHNLGGRTLSRGSLDGSTGNLLISTHPSSNHRMSSPDETSSPTLRVQNSMFETLDHEKTVLVEKICQLKKSLARRDERIEFFEGHTSQLTEDLKKKSKIIQCYIVRDESGALVPPEADVNKERARRRSGVMASVFSGSAQKGGSGGLTLELSLEINRKMQAVLEDTLIKNITLKQNLETLGGEIARLSAQLNSDKRSSASPRR